MVTCKDEVMIRSVKKAEKNIFHPNLVQRRHRAGHCADLYRVGDRCPSCEGKKVLVVIFLLFPNFLLKIDKICLCLSDKTRKNRILPDLYGMVIAFFFQAAQMCLCSF